jgi:Asp-tRNA(Asn)/Glu-tRNA(Gln) amidotransferase A subunit family amidase
MTASDPCFLSVAEAAALIAAKRLSPVELVQAYLARIERLDGTLHAYVRVLPDEALAAARAAEADIAAGGYRGPLHGIPMGLKDIYDTARVATEGGSKLCLGRVPAADATTVRLLKQAGAIVLGKLTTWEFAIGGTAFDTPFPPARNPWIPNATPQARRAVRVRRWLPACARWRWAATPAGRSAGRLLGAVSPVSSRLMAGSAGSGSCRYRSASIIRGP